MAPYTDSVSQGRCDDSMLDADSAIPSYVNGNASQAVSDQQAPLENASDIADLKAGLQLNPKHIPCGYLYNDRGSQLYEEITKLEEYYPFKTEKDLLSQHATQIVTSIPTGSVIVELGCGNAEKTSVLLHALMARDGPNNVHFLGIDVSMEALHMARANLLKACPDLSSKGIEMVCADYLEGLKQARARHPTAMLCVLWLGSSVGNLKPHEAVGFFQSMQQSAGAHSQVFLCTDLWKDAATLHAAYCDSKGMTEAFIKNGMAHALHALGIGAKADPSNWRYNVVINPVDRRVEMWLVAEEDVPQVIEGVDISKGERILMEMSRKFTPEDIRQLAFQSNFYVQDTWRNSKYSMQMLVSTAEAVQRCWKATDALFGSIEDWSVQPIDVRRPFGFYYGHLASFAKLKLLPKEKESDMDQMYSRGIDPMLAEPSKCHSHPDAPPEWPAQHQVQAYAQKVRKQLQEAFDQGKVTTRDAYLAVEHEWMHLETLAYMLAQEQRLSFERSATAANRHIAQTTDSMVSIDSSSDDEMPSNGHELNGHSNGVTIGNSHDGYCDGVNGHKLNGHGQSHAVTAHDRTNGVTDGVTNEVTCGNSHDGCCDGVNGLGPADGDLTNGNSHIQPSNGHVTPTVSMLEIPAGDVTLGTDVDPSKNFVWDNEGPKQAPQHVSSFQMASRSVSNAEFYKFTVEGKGYEQEEYWMPEDLACLKTRKQSCPATWTVQASGKAYVHEPGKTVLLSSVEHEPVWVSLAEAQAYCRWVGGRVMTEEEYERAAGHTSFDDRALELQQGGWEWTTTPFYALDGFKPMSEYPEYSADFFDDHHYVVKGSSPYTHISLIRQSFRNYYQKEYPYVFAKFRVCQSVE